MTSSKFTDNVDLKNVNIKSESHTVSTEDMVSMKCVYDLMFNKIEPSNNNKLKVLNHLINKTTDVNELRKYYSKRVGIFFNMRRWKNVLDDIDHIQQYGELNGAMSILKVKASIQNELP
ncbi:unnamed protein product, partial [Rotaria magnacalcarata]